MIFHSYVSLPEGTLHPRFQKPILDDSHQLPQRHPIWLKIVGITSAVEDDNPSFQWHHSSVVIKFIQYIFAYIPLNHENNMKISSSVHIFHQQSFINPIWVNYNISPTWIVRPATTNLNSSAILGWFPLLLMILVKSQWGRDQIYPDISYIIHRFTIINHRFTIDSP